MEVVEDLAHQVVSSNPSSQVLELGGGLCGLALFTAHVSRYLDPDRRFSNFASECVSRTIEQLPTIAVPRPGLFTGVSGIAWAIEHVASILQLNEYTRPEAFEDIAEFVCDYITQRDEYERDYDLINGLAGIGLWALTIKNSQWQHRIVVRVLELLKRSSQQTDAGTTWPTPAVRTRLLQRLLGDRFDHLEYNLGLAHGIPGVMGFLCICLHKGYEPDLTRSLLMGALSWLSRSLLPSTSYSAFANSAGRQDPARLAWCYGDGGIALALHATASTLGSSAAKSLAREVTRRFALRRLENSGVIDASVCHGSAGILHICSKLLRHEQSSELRQSHRYWLDVLLTMRSPEHGICGFPSWNSRPDGYFKCPGLLAGASGVGLVLLTQAVGATGWDYPFLMS